jgi:glutathione S-transferase
MFVTLPRRNGTFERYRLQEWLNFISAEVHKSFGALFQPTVPDDYKTIAKDTVAKRSTLVDGQLQKNGPFLMGSQFSVADAYLFVMTTWAGMMKMDLGQWPSLKRFADTVSQRPKVQQTLREEGLLK